MAPTLSNSLEAFGPHLKKQVEGFCGERTTKEYKFGPLLVKVTLKAKEAIPKEQRVPGDNDLGNNAIIEIAPKSKGHITEKSQAALLKEINDIFRGQPFDTCVQ